MKYLLLAISLTSLASCEFNDFVPMGVRGPKFKVGQCVASKTNISSYSEKEEWEKRRPLYVEKILKLGKNKYRTVATVRKNMNMYTSISFIMDRYYSVVECPEQLKEITE